MLALGGADVRARRLEPREVDDPESAWPGYDKSPLLEGASLQRYQSVSALLNYVALDRPDLLYPIVDEENVQGHRK